MFAEMGVGIIEADDRIIHLDLFIVLPTALDAFGSFPFDVERIWLDQ